MCTMKAGPRPHVYIACLAVHRCSRQQRRFLPLRVLLLLPIHLLSYAVDSREACAILICHDVVC